MVLDVAVTRQRDALFEHFKNRISVNRDLDRRLVSYQADKDTRFYGWFKYREGFTSRLVNYLLGAVHPQPGVLLDPFAGSGSALFGAAALGWKTQGIELLPVGIHAMQARFAAQQVDPLLFARAVETLLQLSYAACYDPAYQIEHIAITRGAFPVDQERELVGYIAYCHKHITDEAVRILALYASFCVLEEISYTRKDGQYLRWDGRSGRSPGKKIFHKGEILPFATAIRAKLGQMSRDIAGAGATIPSGQLAFDFSDAAPICPIAMPQVTHSSCLEALPELPEASIDVIFTSPPYCNRYDYTRTYALELVYLGARHEDVTRLRQAMLSCTVENKSKEAQLRLLYESMGRRSHFDRVDTVFHSQAALQEVLSILDQLRDTNGLNNPHIARLVRNYFYEMCFVIAEMARVLAPGGHVIMVNDNVRYAGEEVPVDLILSSMAESFGLVVEKIWTLARGKGNSSQQMGVHGRSELRKCVYIWRKPCGGIERGLQNHHEPAHDLAAAQFLSQLLRHVRPSLPLG